jgi:hypothetical protein
MVPVGGDARLRASPGEVCHRLPRPRPLCGVPVLMSGRCMIRQEHASRVCETTNEDSLAVAATGHALSAACASRLRGD